LAWLLPFEGWYGRLIGAGCRGRLTLLSG
jgi:hypothetical protein